MMHYRAFGLNIVSDIALPPLVSCDFEHADIVVERNHVSTKGLDSPSITKVNSQTAPGQLWFHPPGIGYFQVSNGSKITVMPKLNADMQSVRLYILGTCMGAIMHQRHKLTIHGNAIKVGDGCVVFAGHSGNGKSTLAAAFHQRGYPLLSDDLAVLDDNLFVQPAYPQIKIWQSTADMLNIDTSNLKRIRYHLNKFAYPLDTEAFCSTPLPIKAMYIISTDNLGTTHFEEIIGANKFLPLRNQTYRIGQIKGLGLKKPHLELCANLANHIKLTRITRPRQGYGLDKLVSQIENHLVTSALINNKELAG